MRRLFLSLFLSLCLAGPAWAVNDFSTDPNCVAVYRFEDGSLTTDSTSNGNTLTATNSPAADTTNYKEGAASVDLEGSSTQHFYRNDSDLSANFPLKNAVGGHTFSTTCWVRPETMNEYLRAVWSKEMSSHTDGTALYTVSPASLGFSFRVTFAVDDWVLNVSGETVDQWYFVACIYDHEGDLMRLYVWDDDASTVLGDTTEDVSTQGEPVIGTHPWWVGYRDGGVLVEPMDGRIDELTVWNRVLTTIEIEKIRDGTFTGGVTPRARVLRLIEN